MSSVGVDDLIDELFPDTTQKSAPSGTSAAALPAVRRQSEWDDDDDDSDEGGRKATAPTHAPPPPQTAAAATGTHPRTRYAANHTFDDDSSSSTTSSRSSSKNNTGIRHDAKGPGTGAYGGASAPTRRLSEDSHHTAPTLRRGMSCPAIHPVPFPSLADSDGAFACDPRCYVTNKGAAVRSDDNGGHPSLQQLRELAANERVLAGCTRAQAMLQKGAFHALPMKLGNGCLDHHGDYTNDGGCPHMLCRACNYMVVRLQGAEWDDDHGRVNLYLTLRNYYPDWCRLASASAVGVEDGPAAARPVLQVNPNAAAYCCQCAWLTVRTPKAMIETKMTDAFLVKAGVNGGHAYATELPLVPGEKRRPPLWVCHGHPQ